MEGLLRVVLLLSLALACYGAVDIAIPPAVTDLESRSYLYQQLYFDYLNLGSTSLSTPYSQQSASITNVEITASCEWDYYLIDANAAWGNDLQPSDYLHINISTVIADDTLGAQDAIPNIQFYVLYTTEYTTLPNREVFDWVLEVDASVTYGLSDNFIELMPCEVHSSGYYWLAINSEEFDDASNRLLYSFTVSRRRGLGSCETTCSAQDVITPLTLGTTYDVFDEFRPDPTVSDFGGLTQGNQAYQDRVRQWRYFSVDVSGVSYVPGSYLTFNVSNVYTSYDPSDFFLAVNFGEVPYFADANLLQTNPDGDTPESCSLNNCFASSSGTSAAACTCTPAEYPCGGTFHPLDRYTTCELTVSPCFFSYDLSLNDGSKGNLWFVGVHLPVASFTDPISYINNTQFSIVANIVQPTVTELTVGTSVEALANLPNEGLVLYDDAVHFHFNLADSDVTNTTNLRIRTVFVGAPSIGSSYQTFTAVRKFDGTPGETFPDYTLAYDATVSSAYSNDGCPCYPTLDFTCLSCGDCEIIVNKCQLSAGDWYVSVRNWGTNVPAPREFQLTVDLYTDPEPVTLTAGIPVFGSLAASQYDFWVVNVPATTTSWLYVELFVKKDTNLYTLYPSASVQILANEQPGETCFPPGDFQCQTDATSNGNCVFLIDSCHLQEGPLYISVFHVPTPTTTGANPTGYLFDSDLKYTLWAEFENPWELANNVTYSDYVYEGQYNHYYVILENVEAGGWWTVEVDNIQQPNNGGYVNAFVNYGSMAGECPCYTSLFSCTDATPSPCADDETCTPSLADNYAYGLQTYTSLFNEEEPSSCCKIEVDSCNLRDGVWYVSVYGEPQDAGERDPTLLTGYTITSILHPGPVVSSLPVASPFVDRVGPNQINHYELLAAQPQSDANLVLTLTWMQDNCGRVGDYSSSFNCYPVQQLTDGGKLILRFASGALALPECYSYPWSCYANTDTYSQCQVIIPYCQWKNYAGNFSFVSVQYVPVSDDYPAQFTLTATVEAEPLTTVVPGVVYYHTSPQNRYFHYLLDVDTNQYPGQKLVFDLYWNTVLDGTIANPQVDLNIGNFAGHRRGCIDCGANLLSAYSYTDGQSIHFELDPCVIQQFGEGQWFFSVYSGYQDFFTLGNEFTLEINFVDAVVDLSLNEWARLTVNNGNVTEISEDPLLSGFYEHTAFTAQNHFRVVVSETPAETETLFVAIDHFSQQPTGYNVYIYYNKDAQAGDCPCYSSLSGSSKTLSVTSCSTTQQIYQIPHCEYTTGTYYFNVIIARDSKTYVPGNLQVSVYTETSPVTDFGTLTNELYTSATTETHLGVAPFLYFDQYIEDWFDPSSWSSAAALYAIAVSQDVPLIHYTFETTAQALVYYAVHDLVVDGCATTIADLQVYYLAQQGPYIPLVDTDPSCGGYSCYNPTHLCDYTTAEMLDPSIPCAGTFDRCTIGTTNYLTFLAEFSDAYRGLDPNPVGVYASGVASATFSLKLWYQNPYPLTEGEAAIRNVTHYFGGVQEFAITVTNSGEAPITQIVFTEINQLLNVWVRPADADICVTENCGDAYLSNCIEVRGGYSQSNNDVFVNLDTVPAGQLNFGIQCGDFDSCTVSLLPCLLLGADTTSWIVTVELDDYNFGGFASSSQGVLYANAYRLYYVNLGDVAPSSSWITFPSTFIAARERYPGPEDSTTAETYTKLSGMDDYQVYTISIGALGTSANSSIDSSEFERLEIQVYSFANTDTNAYASAAWVAYIAKEADGGVLPIVPLPSDITTSASAGYIFSSAENCDSCNAAVYACFSDGTVGNACDGESRFVVPSCCLSEGTYYLVIRLLNSGSSAFGVRVRLVDEPALVFVSSANFENDVVTPYDEALSSTFVEIVGDNGDDLTGIEPDNYRHYYTTLSTAQFYDASQTPPVRHSLIFNLTIDDGDLSADRSGGNVWLYVRRGARAGRNSISLPGLSYGNDNCWQNTYVCVVQVDGDICVIEIPSSQLAADDWYFSVYNDAWYSSYVDNLDDPTASTDAFYNYLGFDLDIYLRPEGLNNDDERVSSVIGDFEIDGFCLNQTESGPAPAVAAVDGYQTSGDGSYIHYSFEVTQAAIDACLTGGAQSNCVFEKFLRITVENVADTDLPSNGPIDAYISYPYTLTTSNVVFQLAGQPGSSGDTGFRNVPGFFDLAVPDSVTNDQILGLTANSVDTFPDRAKCGTDLVAGIYYVSFRTWDARTYSLCAELHHPSYAFFNTRTDVVESSTNDETDTVLIGSDSFTYATDFSASSDATFRYTFQLTDADVSDNLHYLVVNITNIIDCRTSTATDCTESLNPLSATLWRTDCENYDSITPYNYAADDDVANSVVDSFYLRTTISGYGLAPCSLEAGSYYLEITNTNFDDFDLFVFLRKALLTSLSINTPVFSQIWRYQYEVYSYDYSANPGHAITATLDQGVSCGDVEMWAKWGQPGGPTNGATSFDFGLATCESCASSHCNTIDSDDFTGSCQIFLDLCDTTPLAGTWYFTVGLVEQDWDTVNFVEYPVTYSILITEDVFTFEQVGLGCPYEIVYNDTEACLVYNSADIANPNPTQYVFQNEIVAPFTQVRFTVEGVGSSDVFFVISQNKPVPFLWDKNGEYSLGDSDQLGCADCTKSNVYSRTFRSGAYNGYDSCNRLPSSWLSCYRMAGPTEFYAWIEAPTDQVFVTMERWVPYIPIVNPYVQLSGAINIANAQNLASGVIDFNARNAPFRPNIQYYSLSSIGATGGLQIISLLDGSIQIDIYYSAANTGLDCLKYAPTINDGSDHSESYSSPIYRSDNIFLTWAEADYLSVTGTASDSCRGDTCAPVLYTFEFTTDLPITYLSCGSETCQSFAVDPAVETNTFQASRFHIDTPYTIDHVRDATFSAPNYFVDIRAIDSSVIGNDPIFSVYSEEYASSSTSASTCLGTQVYQEYDLCPLSYRYYEVTPEASHVDTPFSFRIASECSNISVTDVTTQVLATGGFSATQSDEAFVFSFDLSAASTLEFTHLQTGITSVCGVTPTLTVSFNGPSNTSCDDSSTIESECATSPVVYYYTIHCSAACTWTFTAQLETLSSSVLTLGSRSNLFSLGNNEIGIYRVDVPADAISIDSYLQIEVLSIQYNAEFWRRSVSAQVSTTGQLHNYEYDGGLNCDCGNWIRATSYSSAFGYDPVLFVESCQLVAGSYYVTVQANDQFCDDAHPTLFALRPVIQSRGIAVIPFTASTTGSVYNGLTFAQYNYYSVATAATDLFAQFRLANVLGGDLTLNAQADYVARLPSTYSFADDRFNPFQGGPYNDQQCDFDCFPDYSCSTSSETVYNAPIASGCTACAFYVPVCDFSAGSTYYLTVYATTGFDSQQEDYAPITYTVAADVFSDFTAIAPGETSTAVTFSALSVPTQRSEFAFGNDQYFFYSLTSTSNVESVRINVDLTGTTPHSAVWIDVYATECLDEEPVFSRFCGLEYSDWLCELHIPTRAGAAHYNTYEGTYYIRVFGREGTFSISYTAGTDNCEIPSDELSFCSSFVDYPVWTVQDQAQLDSEALCRYEQLLWRFQQENTDLTACTSSDPCYTDVSVACKDALQQFSCYESFPPCDLSGFITGTCQSFCASVEEICGITFSSVDLVHFDCASNRYLSDNCAGSA